MLNVVGYLGLQVVVTLLASIVILRWATAPFVSAQANLRAAINDESLRASRRWHSEIPAFDRTIRLFAESLRAGQKQTEHRNLFSMSNYPFLLKFVATFTILSLSTGYVMSILVDSAYRRIIDITVQVVKTTPQMAHYFLTQQDALHRVNFLTMAISLALYFCVGLRISNYMMNMALMFTRAIHQDRFPISLRADDLYQDLATTLNEARSKHQRGRNEKL